MSSPSGDGFFAFVKTFDIIDDFMAIAKNSINSTFHLNKTEL